MLIKILKSLSLSAVLSALCIFVLFILPLRAERAVIAVLLSRNALEYREALRGFKSALSDAGVDAEFSEFDLDGSPEEGHRVIDIVKSKYPRMILAVGSIAAEVVYNEAEDFPSVFSAVVYPEDAGFTSTSGGSQNSLTGASLDVDPADQFRLLRSIMPGVKRIGVIYDPSETRIVVTRAKAAAAGLGIELVSVPVYSSNQVPAALKTMNGRADALWSVADGTVFDSKSLKYIVSYSIKNRVPLIGISPYFVKEGALVSASADYFDVGRQSGELALLILKGRTPSQVTPAKPRKFITAVNLRTARKIGLKVPQDLIDSAGLVIK